MPLVWTNLEPCTYKGQPLLAEKFVALCIQMYLYVEFLSLHVYACICVSICMRVFSFLHICAHASLRTKPCGILRTRRHCAEQTVRHATMMFVGKSSLFPMLSPVPEIYFTTSLSLWKYCTRVQAFQILMGFHAERGSSVTNQGSQLYILLSLFLHHWWEQHLFARLCLKIIPVTPFSAHELEIGAFQIPYLLTTFSIVNSNGLPDYVKTYFVIL